MARFYLSLLLIICCLIAMPMSQSRVKAGDKDVVAIVNGKVYTMAGDSVLERGTVLIENGRITAIGANVTIPAGAKKIDATGKIVMPGIIDSMTHMGLQEIGLVDVTVDTNEAIDPIVPQVRAVDAINIESVHLAVSRINGITSVLSTPGNANVIAGQSAFMRLDGNSLQGMLIKPQVALHMTLGETPKSTYGRKNKAPQTRMGLAAVVRDAFIKARNYDLKLQEYQRKLKQNPNNPPTPTPQPTPSTTTTGDKAKEPEAPPMPPDRDIKLEVLIEVLKGNLPVIAEAERLDDIQTAMRLADEFGFKLILANATEAYKIAPQLAARQIPVIYGPINQQPATMETMGAIYEAAAMLQKAGVKLAIHSGNDGFAEMQSRNLPFMTGLAVSYGLPYLEALKAITINPAQILGVDKEVGSLEVGKSADVVIFDGDPLEPKSKVLHVFIAGREVPLRSYQTDLYEKYR